MRLTSNTISAFLHNVENYVKNILHKEFHIQVHHKTFEINSVRYPIVLAVFDDLTTHAYFDHRRYLIALNKDLMATATTPVLQDILRHELIHYLSWIHFPREFEQSTEHGTSFNKTCKLYGVSSEVQKARVNIAHANVNNQNAHDINCEKMIQKVQKLLTLSSSSNEHEAHLAMVKANQIMLEYNLEKLNISAHAHTQEEETIYSHEVLRSLRTPPRYHAIIDILEDFYVLPIFCHFKGGVSIEVSGTRPNVLIADYVAKFLDKHLEDLWANEKKNLKSKLNFMIGIGKGHRSKIRLVQQDISQPALVHLKHQLENLKILLYPHLRSKKTSFNSCQESLNRGERCGKELQIRKGIEKSSWKETRLIT